MELVDTHCHIQSAGLSKGERATRELWAKAPDLSGDQIVANAMQNEVTRMICVGCDLGDSKLAIEFSQSRENCWASIGIHPHEAKLALDDPEVLPTFAELATAKKVVAVGECGLDYFYNHSPREQQIEVLKFQLELAIRHNLPVIFHVREAFEDFWPIFDSYGTGNIRGVLHSFTDNQENMQKGIERGLLFGVNGIATFAKHDVQIAMYKAIPPDHLLLETDAPFLTPVPFRGKINEPKQIKTIANFLAELRGETVEQIAEYTTQNARNLFDL